MRHAAHLRGGHPDLLAELAGVPVRDGPGIKQRDFDVEDQIDQRDDVEAKVELHPRIADDRLAAFINGGLFRIGNLRAGEEAKHHIRKNENRPKCEEDRDGKQQFHCAVEVTSRREKEQVAGGQTLRKTRGCPAYTWRYLG